MPKETILKDLNWRYATKQFDPSQKLSPVQVSLVQETLRLSPSSFGLQPWQFLFITDETKRAEIRKEAWNQAQIEDASHLIVLCRPQSIGVADVDRFIQSTAEARDMDVAALQGYSDMIKGFMSKMSEEQLGYWMEKQIYVALGSLLHACARTEIDACPMEGFDRDGVDRVLDLGSKNLKSVVLCTLGFRNPDDKYASLAKVRKPTEEVILEV